MPTMNAGLPISIEKSEPLLRTEYTGDRHYEEQSGENGEYDLSVLVPTLVP